MSKLGKYQGEELDCVVIDPSTGKEVGRVRAFIPQAEDNIGFTIKILEPTPMYPDVLDVDVDNPDDYLYCGNYTGSHISQGNKEALTNDACTMLDNIIRTGEFKVPGELGETDNLFEFNGWPAMDNPFEIIKWTGGPGCAF